MGTQRYIDMTFDLSYPIEQPKFLQRLGETIPTDIVVQVKNKGVNYNLAGVTLGFEMRNDNDKIMIDKDQSRFTIVSAAQGIFSYRPPEQMQSFFGNSYLAYFTFESGGTRITTERFRFYNDEDVQLAIAPELQEHYVSVIDDLIESNEGAMAKAEEIKNLIQNNQVVKKVGDTMTGNLLMEGASAISQRFKAGATGAQVGWESLTDGTFRMFDWTNNRNILSYNPVTDYVTLNRKHPYLVTTGGTMLGDLRMEQGKIVRFLNVGNTETVASMAVNGSNKWYAWSDSAGAGIFEYDPATKMFNMQAATNLAKKTGDTFTGSMTFDNPITLRGAAANMDMRPQVSGAYQKGFRHTVNTTNNFYAVAPIDENGSATWANQFSLNGTTGVFDVRDINVRVGSASNVVTKLKDGQVTLVLTENATNVNSGYMPLAERRGNTVTVRMEITRNANSSSPIVCNLPVDMRPPITVSQYFVANDGSAVGVNVIWDGKVEVYTTGKPVKIVFTYVVN